MYRAPPTSRLDKWSDPKLDISISKSVWDEEDHGGSLHLPQCNMSTSATCPHQQHRHICSIPRGTAFCKIVFLVKHRVTLRTKTGKMISVASLDERSRNDPKPNLSDNFDDLIPRPYRGGILGVYGGMVLGSRGPGARAKGPVGGPKKYA